MRRPRFLRRIDRMLFTSHAGQDRLENFAVVAMAATIALSLAAIFWG